MNCLILREKEFSYTGISSNLYGRQFVGNTHINTHTGWGKNTKACTNVDSTFSVLGIYHVKSTQVVF